MKRSSASSLVLLIFVTKLSYAEELWFPTSLIKNDGTPVASLNLLQKGHQQPGKYLVEVNLNGFLNTVKSLYFKNSEEGSNLKDSSGLTPCFTAELLQDMGVRQEILESLADTHSTCIEINKLIPDAKTVFAFQKMILEVSIPQVALRNQAKGGWAPPELWDDGITALILNYNASHNDNRTRTIHSQSNYFRLGSGLNFGPWRLRDDRNLSTYKNKDGSYHKWSHGNTYLQRGIVNLKSQMTFGDATTNDGVFDSIGYRGLQIATDDSMSPDNQRGFAPIIRGTVSSNAEITVRQNGYVIYRTNVAPGAFDISDIYPIYANGELNVEITEASGSQRSMVIPYGVVPVLLRENHRKFAVVAGKFRRDSDYYEPINFAQASLITGLSANTTIYGGAQYAKKYHSALAGIGVNLGRIGALSFDISHANSTLPDGSKHEGQSVRFLYSQALSATNTDFKLTGYRYSTKGFHTIDEVALKNMSGFYSKEDENGSLVNNPVTDYYNLYNNKRQLIQANITQKLGDAGSVYLMGNRQTYWNRSSASESLQAGYSNTIAGVHYNISYSRNKTANFRTADKYLSLSLSVPLSRFLPNGYPSLYATLNSSKNSNGQISQQAGLSGMLDKSLSWSVSKGYSRGEGSTSNINVGYQGNSGQFGAGYSQSKYNKQTNFNATGSVIVHDEGITFGQMLNDSGVLVAVPGVKGIPVGNGGTSKTDWRGYAISENVSNYRENNVSLDTSYLDAHTEVDNSVSRVVPTRGALVKVSFKARTGLRALFTLTSNGRYLPFGTVITTKQSTGIVGDEGQVFLSGLEPESTLTAQWGNNSSENCSVRYSIPEKERNKLLIRAKYECSHK